MSLKTVGFRPNKEELEILKTYKREHNLKTLPQALRSILARYVTPLEPEKTKTGEDLLLKSAPSRTSPFSRPRYVYMVLCPNTKHLAEIPDCQTCSKNLDCETFIEFDVRASMHHHFKDVRLEAHLTPDPQKNKIGGLII